MIEGSTVARSDQTRALALSTIAFTACFAVWTIFAIIGVQIKGQLGLTETQFGLLVATPILTGSLTRVMLGIWTEQYGGRIVFPAVMLSAALLVCVVARTRCPVCAAATPSFPVARSRIPPARMTSGSSPAWAASRRPGPWRRCKIRRGWRR